MSAPAPTPRKRRRSITTVIALLLVSGIAGWFGWQHWQVGSSPSPGNASTGPGSVPGQTGAGAGIPGTGGTGRPGGATGPGGPGGAARWGGGSRAMPVLAGVVERRDLLVIQPAIGTILALNTAVVRARVEGELRAIHFTEGQQVRAGQLLAEIDPRPYEVQLAQAEGQLARDQAQLANAQIDLARYRDLAARDSIARQQVDTQEALVKQLGGTIRINQAAVDNARLLLSYTRVTAPISGQVGLRQVDLGNVVRASDPQGLITITQTQPISVIFSLPEAALPRLRAGMRGAERPTVEVWDRDRRTRLAMGAVSSLDNAIDPATGTIRVKAQFDNRDGVLYPNQFVNIRLQLDTLAGATVVPSNSVQRGATGSFVYRINEAGVVSVRPIEVLAVEGDWAGVRGDLSPGDRVVTDGADRLRDGAQVEVIAPARGRPGAAPTPGMPPTTTTGARPGVAPAAGAAPPSGTAPASAEAPANDRPPWLDRLPPEQQERFMKMSPAERQTFIEQMRERRRQQQGG